MTKFTDREQQVMDKIVEAHNLYVELESTHPSDTLEWVDAVHRLQQILGLRVLRREMPDVFVTLTD